MLISCRGRNRVNWEAVGAIGEVTGAVVVVITLIYLTLQLRQNALQIRLSSSQTASNTYSSRMREVLSDPAQLTVFRAGLDTWEDLSRDDQARFHAIMMGFQVSYLQNRQLHQARVIPEDVFRSWEDDWIRILKCTGAQAWWTWAQPMLDPDTVSAVNQLVSDSTAAPLNRSVLFLRPD